MDSYQKEKAVIALRKIECEKDVKTFKLHEYYRCQRLALLLRLPFSIIKQHVAVHASVGSNGLLRLEVSDEIPINEYLIRDSKDTFETWLKVNHPHEFARYQRDPIRFRFGTNTALVFTDEMQKLVDEYDRFTWVQTEEMRRYYFSSLLADADIDSMNEFDLFGCADGSHTPQEVQDFKRELLNMKRAYNEHPEKFFHPADDLGADADSTGAVV
jgi:hypothetical protein